MAYEQDGYRLHMMQINWRGDPAQKRTIYFFSKKPAAEQKKGTPCDIPDGMEVGSNKRTGMLFLRKKK